MESYSEMASPNSAETPITNFDVQDKDSENQDKAQIDLTEQKGWVKLHRKILDWEWFCEDNMFRVFVYFLLKSNHTEKKWKGHFIERGQCITSLKKISSDLNLTERKVRTAIKKLSKTREIIIKTTSKYSLITITKYDFYQKSEPYSDKQDVKQDVNQMSIKCQTNAKQMSTNNNDKKSNNKKNNKEVTDYSKLKLDF